MVSSSKYVALVGGQDPHTKEPLDIVQVFSPHNLEEPLKIGKPHLAIARYSPACVIYEDNLFVYGGYTANGFAFSSVEMIDLSGAGIQSSWEIEIAPKLPFN